MPVKLRLLLDNDVPDSVGQAFTSHGHEITYVRDILPVTSADQLIAAVSELDDMILVVCDGDYKVVAPRIPKGYRARFRKLSRIVLQCVQLLASKRMEAAMSFVEREFDETQTLRDKRMYVVIQKDGMKTLR